MSCRMARILLRSGSKHDLYVRGSILPSHVKPYLSVQMRTLVHYLGHRNIQHTVRYTELAPHRFRDFWDD